MRPTPPISARQFLNEKLLEHLGMKVVAGEDGLDKKEISNPRLQKPGLALAGFLPYVKPGRIQILGESEFDYLATVGPEEAIKRLARVVECGPPLFLATKGHRPPREIVDLSNELGVPFLSSQSPTSIVIEAVSGYLEDELAPRLQMHGVLVDVHSLGTLIIGDAGIGKSECALELIHRGHRLVADDVVVIKKAHNQGLRGSAHELLQNYLELRGVGIIDVRKHFGMTATSTSVTISLVITLMKWNKSAKEMEHKWRERVAEHPRAWTSTQNILGVEVPKYSMTVAPGRHVAIMVETAVRKCLLAQRGIEDEKNFLETFNQIAAGERIGGGRDDDNW